MERTGLTTPSKRTPTFIDLESEDDNEFFKSILASFQPPRSETPDLNRSSGSPSTSAWFCAKVIQPLDRTLPIGALFSPGGGLQILYADQLQEPMTPTRPIADDTTASVNGEGSSCRKRHRSGLMKRETILGNKMAQADEFVPIDDDDDAALPKRKRPRRGHRSFTQRPQKLRTTEPTISTTVPPSVETSTTKRSNKRKAKTKEQEDEISEGESTPVDSAAKQNPVPQRQSKRQRLSGNKDTSRSSITVDSNEINLIKTPSSTRKTRARTTEGKTASTTPSTATTKNTRKSKPAKTSKTKQDQEPNLAPDTALQTPDVPTESPSNAPILKPDTTAPSTPKRKKPRSPTKSPFFPSSSTPSKSKERLSSRAYTPIPPLSAKSFGIIQERLAEDPFQLLVAVQFLNKTKGTAAVPVFYDLMSRYPTPEALANADHDEVVDLIRHLGLQEQRARRVIALARKWLTDPPERNKRYRTLHYPSPSSGTDIKPLEILEDNDTDARDGAFEVAHLPGSGAYALDSWRIFCRDTLRGLPNTPTSNFKPPKIPNTNEDTTSTSTEVNSEFEPEWKRVVPLDKELRVYLRWKWLQEGWFWDPLTGNKEKATDKMMDAANQGRLVWETWDLEGTVKVKDSVSDIDSPGNFGNFGNIEKLGSRKRVVSKTGEVWDGIIQAAPMDPVDEESETEKSGNKVDKKSGEKQQTSKKTKKKTNKKTIQSN